MASFSSPFSYTSTSAGRSDKIPAKPCTYHAFEGLQDALDGDLDAEEAARIEAQLAIARQSDRDEIVSLAEVISHYLQKEKQHLSCRNQAN